MIDCCICCSFCFLFINAEVNQILFFLHYHSLGHALTRINRFSILVSCRLTVSNCCSGIFGKDWLIIGPSSSDRGDDVETKCFDQKMLLVTSKSTRGSGKIDCCVTILSDLDNKSSSDQSNYVDDIIYFFWQSHLFRYFSHTLSRGGGSGVAYISKAKTPLGTVPYDRDKVSYIYN